ncbi:MAG: hypothetical protein K2N93_03130, partial [Alistipes sp.]|nr:hypothetical protein [Alistipes sp.]
RTQIARLTDAERVSEIAKMLSGADITEAALAQARILLGDRVAAAPARPVAGKKPDTGSLF